MNKTDLINQLAERFDGDKKTAQVAVEGFIDLVQREVQKGRNVSISGFGVFEKRTRAARSARNPRTGEAVKVKKTNVPVFRPGRYFRDVIAGTVKLPKPSLTPLTARAAAAAARAAATGRAVRKATTVAAAGTAGTRAAATKSAGPTSVRPRSAAAKTLAASKTGSRSARSTAPAAGTTVAAAGQAAPVKAPTRRAAARAAASAT